MFTIPILATIAVGSAISAAVSGWVNHRLGYAKGEAVGFGNGLDAAAAAAPPPPPPPHA